MPRLTLQVARGQAAQQQALDAWSATAAGTRAVIAEGAFFELQAPAGVTVERLAAGCVCCVGLVPMRVTLTRLLRNVRPDRILLLAGDDAHLARLRNLATSGALGVAMEIDP